MEKKANWKWLPFTVAALGMAGLLLRRLLYSVAVDHKGLLVSGHPLELGLWAVTAVAVAVLSVAAWKLDGSNAYEDNFSPSVKAAVCHILAGAGLLLTVLLNEPTLPGTMGKAWKLLGLLSGAAMAAAGFFRVLGRKPWFWLHLLPGMFLALHLLSRFQTWSADPQMMDYLFSLAGAVALLMFSIQTASFAVGLGNRRLHLFWGLLALYCCTVNVLSPYPGLYLGGALWAGGDLCSLEPKPKKVEDKGENPGETA